MHGYVVGKASGMAPRARIAVYKALYRLFGGFVSDVVAAIEQLLLRPIEHSPWLLQMMYSWILQHSSTACPSDCQKPEVLNKNLVEGNILLCGYSFNFVVGTASIKKVSETAKSLGAIGFVLAVESSSPGTKYDPVPVGLPGILIADVSKSMELINYYNISTSRDWTGRVRSFKAVGSIGDGMRPILHKSAPQVALFSGRGPNIKDYNFQEADLLKPDILAPGSLIWAAWSPNGTDEANYSIWGAGFAMISGTSMAAPHIAGIAALVKQKHYHWSPAAIKSALMTTSTTLDRAGRPLQAEQYSGSETVSLVPATPFDYGSGHVNPRAALDPGLIFDAGSSIFDAQAGMGLSASFMKLVSWGYSNRVLEHMALVREAADATIVA